MVLWSVLARLAVEDPDTLRGQSVTAAHRSIAFIEFRCLSVADEMPFKLCRGDIDRNMQDLMNGSEPSEGNTRNLWQLLHERCPWSAVKRMITLIGQTSFSTLVVEQLHASAAMISRYHPEYQLAQLMGRSMIYTINKILPRPCKLQRNVSKYEKQLATLEKRCPSRAGARQTYMGVIMAGALERAAQKHTANKWDICKFIGKRHATRFLQLPAVRKEQLKVRSKAKASAARQALAERRARVSSLLIEARTKVKQDALTDKPLFLASAKWTQLHLQKFAELDGSAEFSPIAVQRKRDKACVAPPRMSPTLIQHLDAQEINDKPAQSYPDWIGRVTRLRACFQKNTFLATDGAEQASVGSFDMQCHISSLLICTTQRHMQLILESLQDSFFVSADQFNIKCSLGRHFCTNRISTPFRQPLHILY